MKLFGRTKAAPNTQETIARLRQTIEMLEKRQKFLQEKADRKEEEAKMNGTFDTLSTQIFALENAKMNMEIMDAMRGGARTLADLQNNITVDKVDDTIEEIQTQMEIHEEISRAISQPLGTQEEDEDELLRELAELEQEDLDAQLLNIKAPPTKEPQIKFPVASTVRPEATSSKEDDEYRALEESLAM
eukprot:gene4391-5138_t